MENSTKKGQECAGLGWYSLFHFLYISFHRLFTEQVTSACKMSLFVLSRRHLISVNDYLPRLWVVMYCSNMNTIFCAISLSWCLFFLSTTCSRTFCTITLRWCSVSPTPHPPPISSTTPNLIEAPWLDVLLVSVGGFQRLSWWRLFFFFWQKRFPSQEMQRKEANPGLIKYEREWNRLWAAIALTVPYPWQNTWQEPRMFCRGQMDI